MTSIGNHIAAASSQLPATLPPRFAQPAGTDESVANRALNSKAHSRDEVREKFTQFVGEAFFGQMIKAMRSTVGKPAYFHGGRGEEVFQGQLDQQLAQHLTAASADKFAEPMFERQFPNLAKSTDSSQLRSLEQLSSLSRR
jgi:hypothetical protein